MRGVMRRWVWPTAFVALLAILQLAVGGSIVRDRPVPVPIPIICPRPVSVTLTEDEDGKICALVQMSDGAQRIFCREPEEEAREGPSPGLEGSRA